MESVDEILIHSLRLVGVPFLQNNKVVSVKDLQAGEVISCVGHCLRIILQDESIPCSISKEAGVGTRHKVCSQLAQKVKDLGYTQECGYNQLLYPVEKESRQLLSWVVEKLPKSSRVENDDSCVERSTDGKSEINHLIKTAVKHWSASTWVFPVTQIPSAPAINGSMEQNADANVGMDEFAFSSQNIRIPGDFPDVNDYENDVLPIAYNQCNSNTMIASLLEKNASRKKFDSERPVQDGDLPNVLKERKIKERVSNIIGEEFLRLKNQTGKQHQSLGSLLRTYGLGSEESRITNEGAFRRATKFTHESATDVEAAKIAEGLELTDKDVDEEQLLQRRKEEINCLNSELQSQRDKMDEIDVKSSKLIKSIHDSEQLLNQINEAIATLKAEKALKQKVLEMLPHAKENVMKLEEIVKNSEHRLVRLSEEWDQHRIPLEARINEREQVLAGKKEKYVRQIGIIKRLKEEMKIMIEQAQVQDTRVKLLEEEYTRLPKTINRSLYTFRIMEIIKQVRKQNAEIERVIDDIRVLQKDINTLSQKLKRTEAIADETVFRLSDESRSKSKSKVNDQAHVQSYKLLTDMRQLFDNLIEIARETGKAQNHGRDIESRSENLSSRIKNTRVERILKDLAQVKNENKELKSQIEALS